MVTDPTNQSSVPFGTPLSERSWIINPDPDPLKGTQPKKRILGIQKPTLIWDFSFSPDRTFG